MANGTGLDISALETWLWDAACIIRGPIDAPKYKDYILPLIFLKRLSDVFEDELADLGRTARLVDKDHKLVRFYIPPDARWPAIQKRTTGLGEYLTDAVRAIARENPKVAGVIDTKDFNETAAGQRILSDDPLRALVQILSQHRLGLKDVEPDILGRAYEYLIRKFAEGQGQSAGEFYTPREVAILMARFLDPKPGDEIYDPACGSAGLLIKCALRFREKHGGNSKLAPLRFYGQEINAGTFAMSRMNVFIHDMEAEIALGDTMNRPAFLTEDGRLRQFHKVTANPMWNQDFPLSTYENDTYGRFALGVPPKSSADWGWIQHMFASLRDGGKMAVVLDTGAVSRGSGNTGSNRERDARKQFVERDLVEAVLLLPENLFYNTTAPGIIMVINRAKRHKGQILLINASKEFSKGKPKNYLTDENIGRIAGAYLKWQEVEKLSKVIAVEEAIRNDYNLSPSRYVAVDGVEEVLPLPPVDEQRRIARVLSTIQRVIEAQDKVITAARELKRSLMKHLFTYGPVPVTEASHVPLKETEIGPVPESWEVVPLGECSRIGNGSTPKRTNAFYWQGGRIPWLTSGKVHESIIERADEFVTEAARSKCHLPMAGKGSIVVAITGQGKTLGNAAMVTFDTCVSQHLAYVSINDRELVPEFALAFLQHRYGDLRRLSQGGGTTKGALTCALLKQYPMAVPPPEEQKLIWKALWATTQKIDAEEKRKAALQALFKSMLHHLMTGKVRVV